MWNLLIYLLEKGMVPIKWDSLSALLAQSLEISFNTCLIISGINFDFSNLGIHISTLIFYVYMTIMGYTLCS